MTDTFPWGLPAPTLTYLLLYMGSLALHVAFMSYVLAGSAIVALAALLGPKRVGALEPICATLRDWLPFALGAAITAGVAPLLFVQILYEQPFYTANLLLSHRWTAMVPVLMLGFYLLYVGKAGRIGGVLGKLVAAGAFACFAFAAYSWAENHLLSLDRDAWPEFYGSGQLTYFSPELPARVAMWMFGAAPVMACAVAWQLRGRAGANSARALAVIAIVGSLGAIAIAAMSANDRAPLLSHGRPYAILLAAGLAAQLGAWLVIAARSCTSGRALPVASCGLVVAVLSTIALREIARLSALDTHALFAAHSNSARAGGAIAFAAFFVINAVIIGWCIRRARRATHHLS